MNLRFSHFIKNDARLGNFHDSGWLAEIYKKYSFLNTLDETQQIIEISLNPELFFNKKIRNESQIADYYKSRLFEFPYLLEFSKNIVLYELFLKTSSEKIRDAILNQKSDTIIFSAFINDKIRMDNNIFNKIKSRHYFLFNLLKEDNNDKIHQYLSFYKETDFVSYFIENTENINDNELKNICDINNFFKKCEDNYNNIQVEHLSNLSRLMILPHDKNSINKRNNPNLLSFLSESKHFNFLNLKKIIFSSQVHNYFKRIIFKNEIEKFSKEIQHHFNEEEVNSFFNSSSFKDYLFYLDSFDVKKERIKINKVFSTFQVFGELKKQYLQDYCLQQISRFYNTTNKNIKSLKVLFSHVDVNLINYNEKIAFILNSLISNNKGKIELTNSYIPFDQYIDRDFIERHLINNSSFLYNTYDFLLKNEKLMKLFKENDFYKDYHKTLAILILNGSSNKLNTLFILNEQNKDIILERKDEILLNFDKAIRDISKQSRFDNKVFRKKSGYYYLKNENISKTWQDIHIINNQESLDLLKSNWSEESIELIKILNKDFFKNKENVDHFVNETFVSKNILALNKASLFYFLETKDISLISKINDLFTSYENNNKYSKLVSAYKLWTQEIINIYPDNKDPFYHKLKDFNINQNSNLSLIKKQIFLDDCNSFIFRELEKISIYYKVKSDSKDYNISVKKRI